MPQLLTVKRQRQDQLSHLIKKDVIGNWSSDGEIAHYIYMIHFDKDDPAFVELDPAEWEMALAVRSYIRYVFEPTHCQHSYDCCANFYRHYRPQVTPDLIYRQWLVWDRLYRNV